MRPVSTVLSLAAQNPGVYEPMTLNCTRHYDPSMCGPVPPFVEAGDPQLRFWLIAAGGAVALVALAMVHGARVLHRLQGAGQAGARAEVARDRLLAGAVFTVILACALVGFGFDRGTSHVIARHLNVLGFTISDARGTDFSKYERAVTLAGYQDRVRAWLHDEYGVTLNRAAVDLLRRGEQIAVTYSGRTVAVELIRDGSGGIAVRQVGGQLLEPVRQQ